MFIWLGGGQIVLMWVFFRFLTHSVVCPISRGGNAVDWSTRLAYERLGVRIPETDLIRIDK